MEKGLSRRGVTETGYSRGFLGERAVGAGEQHQEVEGEARQGPAGVPHGGGGDGGGGGVAAGGRVRAVRDRRARHSSSSLTDHGTHCAAPASPAYRRPGTTQEHVISCGSDPSAARAWRAAGPLGVQRPLAETDWNTLALDGCAATKLRIDLASLACLPPAALPSLTPGPTSK
ncbi:hypothetical protein Pcinc_042850 [Petrolisthes cinctipes]|uniref:Uncharacterized protein n=1 Tax=Petrolisthes cinctipes TaxID=88211 RepID=A0AAE1EIE6_PETCI|nr:hypothetical protein Pcinc_042850 [Petrolisthes cinctipes]